MLTFPATSRRIGSGLSLLLLLAGALLTTGQARSAAPPERVIKPVVPPRQLGELLRGQVIEAGSLINVEAARLAYGVTGTGHTAAVLDTGIRATHTDFAGRVVAQQNYTADNGGDPGDATDGEGHGTNVSGIIMANGIHTGMAPGANVAALKVLNNNGSGGGAGILAALDWVIANRVAFNITVVNMSLGDGGNYTSVASDVFLTRINTLRAARVAVCAAAGNDFFEWDSAQGMGWPAIHGSTVSVGAVYDANIGGISYGGAIAFTTGPDRICPFSQRLHPNVSAANRTDVFAPGAELTSAGITSDTSSSASHGTSQATPVVAGVVILLQQYARSVTGSLPTVDQLESWIRAGAVTINDGDDEDDSVNNTGLNYPRINALAALQAAEQELSTSVSPTNLSAGSISPDSISLTWTDNNTNELGFDIERAVGAGPLSYLVGRGPNTTTYLDQGLSSNTSYTYRVRAFTPLGYTAYTNNATALTFPEDPTNLTVTTPAPPDGRSQLNLSWTDSSDQPTAFQIYRSLNPLNIVNLHAVTAVGVTTFTDTGLASDTTYHYQVRAINARGPSGPSNAAQGTTLPAPTTAPAALTATVESSTSISLRWDDTSSNETGFRLERVRGTSFLSLVEFTSFALGANVTSYVDTNLAPSTTYTYRVFALNASGDSLPSTEAGGATFPEIPADPGAVTVTVESASSLRVDWLDNSSNETGFRIERSSGGGFTQVGAVNANVTTFTNTGLLSNATFTYRVRAVNGVSVSAPSPSADGLTLPATPTALTATPQSSTQVQLNWTDASSSPSAFKIERKTTGGYTEIHVTNVGDVSYLDASASPNTTHTYRIRATNASGDSDYSTQVSGTTPPNPPNAPTGLGVTVVSQSTLLLNWTDASSDETGFKIERSPNGVDYILVATVDANSTGYADNGLAANTTYWFRVRATNAGGDSAASNIVSTSTLPGLPSAPSGLSVSVVSQTELRLNWSDTSSDESGFKIEQSTDGSSFGPGGTTGANVQTFLSGGLMPNTRYYFRVLATNAAGDSAPSSVASAITLPNAPTAPSGPAVAVVSSTSLRVTWTDASDNETAFVVERSLNGATFNPAGSVAANVNSFTDSGLTPSTPYFYRIKAANAGGSSAYTTTVSTTTPPAPPGAPANLAATALTASSIRLDWSDTSTESGFRIERALEGGAFAEVGITGANVLTYTDTGRAANTEYLYRVKAMNAGGDSVPSGTAVGLTLPTAPGSVLAAAASSTLLELTWTETNPQPAAVRVERALIGGVFADIGEAPAGMTTFADGGRSPDTAYQYRLRATNASGFSGYTSVVVGTTLPAAPNTPTGLFAAPAGPGALSLTWTDASDNESGFKIERSLDGASYGQIAMVGAGVAAYADSGLLKNTSYTYRVRAFNAGGHSDYSASATAVTAPDPPLPPSGLAVSTVSASELRLTWSDNSNNETGFKIERSSDGTSFSVISTTAANATQFTNSGLTPAATFHYRVRATNGGGDSDFSGPVSGATLPNAPAAPTNLTAAAQSATAVRLNWMDASGNEDGFIIERRAGGAGEFTERFRTAANATLYAEDVLSGDTAYTYRVRAFNGGGVSSPAEANVSTLTGVLSLTLQRTTSKGGKPVKCTVALTGPAPAGGAVVNITSSAQATAKAPKSVRIAAGKRAATFTIQTRKVGAGAAATITGAYGGQTASAVLTLVR